MFMKIYQRVMIKNGVVTPVETMKIIGLTMLQVEQLTSLFDQVHIWHEVGGE